MKLNFKYTLATLALAALFASCDRTAEFKSEKFISVDNTSYAVDEVAGEVTIPVHIYNPDNNEVNVSVTVLPGTAEEGTDYEVVSPASGVLNFAAGEATKEVKIAIKSHEGVYTGNKSFAIQVASATEGVLVGKFDTSVITINDLDHPLSKFIGDWSGDFNTGRGKYAGHTITIAPVEDDVTKLKINNLEPYFANAGLVAPDYNVFEGEVNEDKTVITITIGQGIGYQSAFIVGTDDAAGDGADAHITIVYNEDGTLTIPNFWGIYGGGWWNYCFGPTVLSK